MRTEELDLTQRFDQNVPRFPVRIFGPPGQNPGPHADQGLRVDVRVDFGGHEPRLDAPATVFSNALRERANEVRFNRGRSVVATEEDQEKVPIGQGKIREGLYLIANHNPKIIGGIPE